MKVSLPLAKGNEGTEGLPHSVFTCMLGMGRGSGTWQSDMLINIAPLLAALPFGISFYNDRKTGYIKNVFTRDKKGDYLWAKYIVTFISGGFVVAFPVFLNFIGNAMILPIINPIKGSGIFSVPPYYLQDIYYDMPIIYIICICLLHFMVGGMLATMCLGVSYLVDIVYLVQLFPLVFVYLYDICADAMMSLKWHRFYNYLQTDISENIVIKDWVEIIGIMALFSVVYFYNGYKEETL